MSPIAESSRLIEVGKYA